MTSYDKLEDLLERVKREQYTELAESTHQEVVVIYDRLRAGDIDTDSMYIALCILGEAGLRKARDMIRDCARHEDEDVRRGALYVLGTLWREKSETPLFVDTLMNDPDEYVRIQAASGLGSMYQGTGDDGVVKVLYRAAMCAVGFDEERRCYESMCKVIFGRNSKEQIQVRRASSIDDIDPDIVEAIEALVSS